MEYRLTQQLIDLAQQEGILDLISWDGGVSSKAYLQRQADLGVNIPQSIIDYYESPPMSSIVVQESSLPETGFDLATTQYYFIEPRTGLKLSQTLFEDGFGISNGSVSPGDYMRRFNGMPLTNKSAMARPYDIVITEIGCVSDKSNAGAYYDCVSYDMNGGDEQILGRLSYTMQNGQMGAAWLNVFVLIPAYRRVTLRTGGASISLPQGWYKYRQVIS